MKGHRGGTWGGISSIIFGIIWCSIAFNITGHGGYWSNGFSFFPFVGLIFVLTGIGTAISQAVKKKDNTQGGKPYYTDSQPQNNNHYNVYKDNKTRCPMCESVVDDEQKFCINCGNKLRD